MNTSSKGRRSQRCMIPQALWRRCFSVSPSWRVCSIHHTRTWNFLYILQSTVMSDFKGGVLPWKLKHPCVNGCFSWMIPNLYMGRGCLNKHPFQTACLEFRFNGTYTLMYHEKKELLRWKNENFSWTTPEQTGGSKKPLRSRPISIPNFALRVSSVPLAGIQDDTSPKK